MNDFNPLTSLVLFKAFTTSALDLPSPRGLVRRLFAKVRQSPRFVRAAPGKRKRGRAFSWPVHASYPSYNLSPQPDAATRPGVVTPPAASRRFLLPAWRSG